MATIKNCIVLVENTDKDVGRLQNYENTDTGQSITLQQLNSTLLLTSPKS